MPGQTTDPAVPALIGAAAAEGGVAEFLAAHTEVPPPVQEAGMQVVEAFGALAADPDDAAKAEAADTALRRLDEVLTADG
jgi:hypothetical protein